VIVRPAGQAARRPGLWRACDLTGREIEILRLAASGRTNIAIAHQLDVSPRTVARHLEHVYRKLGVSSRAAAVSRVAMASAQDPKGRDREQGS
jgi:DNA-binding CsgD family transcriptional regulator